MAGDDLADLQMVTADSLRRFGLADADAVAEYLVADLRRNLAGATVYIDKGFSVRNARIRAEYNGRNAAKLATQYRLTRRRIEQIVNTL